MKILKRGDVVIVNGDLCRVLSSRKSLTSGGYGYLCAAFDSPAGSSYFVDEQSIQLTFHDLHDFVCSAELLFYGNTQLVERLDLGSFLSTRYLPGLRTALYRLRRP